MRTLLMLLGWIIFWPLFWVGFLFGLCFRYFLLGWDQADRVAYWLRNGIWI